jgi:hypothetical protein
MIWWTPLGAGVDADDIDGAPSDIPSPPSIREAQAALSTLLSYLEQEKDAMEADINSATLLLHRLQMLQDKRKWKHFLLIFLKWTFSVLHAW